MRSRFNNQQPTTGKKQAGVAIITALLIVTIAATVSITISTQLQLDVRRTGNLIALDQADIYALQAEKFTQEILRDPDIFSGLMTELRELGKFQRIFPIGNATVEGEITDLNSCINLNSLVNPNLPSPSIDPLVQAQLTRLFQNSHPRTPIPTSMVAAIIDWIDGDSDTTIPNGGEDGHYLNLEHPYRTANQPLSSITELRLIKGAENLQATPRDRYTPYNIILALAVPSTNSPRHFPSLCAFKPVAGSPAKINVNTASRDVLISLSPTMTAAIADDIIACRGPAPNGAEFTNFSDITRCRNVDTIITAADRGQLTYSSDYFLLKTKVSLGDAKKITYSIIFRNPAGTSQIISRTQRTL